MKKQKMMTMKYHLLVVIVMSGGLLASLLNPSVLVLPPHLLRVQKLIFQIILFLVHHFLFLLQLLLFPLRLPNLSLQPSLLLSLLDDAR
jgi:hypothetical protein